MAESDVDSADGRMRSYHIDTVHHQPGHDPQGCEVLVNRESDRFPQIHLAHPYRYERDKYLSRTRVDYKLYPIRVARPATGRAAASVVCGYCQEPVRCSLYSSAAWNRRVVLAASLTLCVVASLCYSLGWFDLTYVKPFLWEGLLVLVLGLLTWVAPFSLMAVVLFDKLVAPGLDGVRLRHAGDHCLRWPGCTTETVDDWKEPSF